MDKPSCLHELFEARASERPEAPAVVSGDRILSYGDLSALSTRIARHLRARGVATRDAVGLLLDRSPDAVVAILSVLKAGAAYVPLDPSHPAERTRRIMEEARIRTLISERDLAALAGRLSEHVVRIDDPNAPWRAQPAAPIDGEIDLTPGDLAYVLYTSGSTGRPKGVMAEHGNAVSFVRAFNQVIRLTPRDRVFQGFALTFDGSVEEMWMALSNGASLVVPPRGAARFGDELAAVLGAGRATVFSTVPTCLSTISDPLASVRLLIVSGERCSKELVRRWATPERRMLNVYGPTETTVNATAAECRPGAEVTIGAPLPGYELHILDPEGRPVGPGEQGELYIAGPGVARGYLGQPELTEKQFVRLPPRSGTGGGVRAYRTGDLVSRGLGGELSFFGRIDNQVKLRGYRVELSEIEAVLCEHPAVRAAVVTLAERDGRAELAAYVVGEGVDRAELHELLSSRLPSYMVPAFLEVLATMPTLPSGKVDRKGLPPPSTPLAGRQREIRAPRTELEATLLRAFRDLFKTNAISIDDDFFRTLGGYSLMAARLVSQLRQELGVEVAIRDVYEHPTIEELGACLSASRATRVADDGRTSGVQRVSSREAFERGSVAIRRGVAALQLVAVYLVYGLWTLPFVGWFLALRAYRAGALSLDGCAAASAAVAAGAWPAMLLFSVLVKWLVVGRYKPGAYPLWGWYYFRCWLVRHVELAAAPGPLAGTPLLPLYLRCMGARIGRNCTIDTVHCAVFDLLEVGDESSVGAETHLLGYHVDGGLLRIGSIAIGRRAFVGTHSHLGLDVRVGDDARLDDLSQLPDGASIPAGTSWRGSPPRPADVAAPDRSGPASSRSRRVLFGAIHLVVLYAIGAALVPTLIPSAALVSWAAASRSAAAYVASIPAAGVLWFVAFCLWIPLLRKVILPRARPGTYATESAWYVRKWALDVLVQTSRAVAKPLYTTIYLPAWLRLLGARIGRRAEISTVSQISPELVDLGDQSFFADGSIIGGRRFHRGMVQYAVSRVGRRSFVGNSAILPVGADLGSGCLLGCLSAPPAGATPTPDGTEWLGSPSFALPHRRKVEGFDESVTHEPTRKLVAQRLAVDALRIVIPSAVGAGLLEIVTALLDWLYGRLSFGAWLAAAPAAAMAAAVFGLSCVVVTKKVLIGTFRPTIRPLWSMFVWLNEVVNGAYETIAAPLLTPLLGTPFCAPWLRMMGCRIGRHVYLETTLFSEFDLVSIDDFAALNAAAVIQNHLFEDRIMKASYLRIGAGCSVGAMAVVLYDTEMRAGASVGPLSLLMKGETLPPGSRWLGIPTARVAPGLPDRDRAAQSVAKGALVERWS